MAGSVGRGANDAEDETLAGRLIESNKDAHEHRVVSQFVVDALRPFSTAVNARGPEVVRFTNIQHLATSVDAQLNHPAADVLTLAAALHPTPAVGGWAPRPGPQPHHELAGTGAGWDAGAAGWMGGGGGRRPRARPSTRPVV